MQFSNELLNSQVFLQRIEGQHQLNGGLEAELICLSTSAQIALKQFIGVQVAVDQVTDSGQLFRTTGIVTEASYGQSDGALTLYKLTLKDATNLWHKRRNSRVFMNKSIIEVTEVLFKEWQEKSQLFATSLSLDLSGLSQSYDIRPFIMQHNESDYDFLTRLWRSEGISWLIDEAELFVPHFTAPIQPQKLRLIDDNSQYQALARRSIRYHRSSATEYQDSITGFVAVRSLQPTAVHVQRWQPDALAHEEGVGSVITTHLHSEQFDSASLSLEQAWHMSPAWMQDLKGEDQATASSSNQLEKLNQQFTDMYASRAKYFKAYSSVRDSQVGYWFNLQEHPEIDQHEGADQEFLIIAKNFYNQNNLPKDLHQQVSQLLTKSRWNKHGYDDIERQGNELTLIGHLVGQSSCKALGKKALKDFISISQAKTYFEEDVLKHEAYVKKAIKVPLYQYEFDALVSLAFNIGNIASKAPNLCKLINESNYKDGPKEMLDINKITVNGKKVPDLGLTKRRKSEYQLFIKGTYDARH